MRAPPRFIGRLFTTLSVLLLLAVLAAWVRGRFASDGFTWTTRDASIYGIAWGGGRFDLARITSDPAAFVETPDALAFEKPKPGLSYNRGDPDAPDEWTLGQPDRDVRFLGVRYRAGAVFLMHIRVLSVPIWMPALLLAVAPTRALVRARRLRTLPPTACPRCGYDCRATPTRCPECGHTPAC